MEARLSHLSGTIAAYYLLTMREEGKKGRREEGKKGRREVFFK